MHEINRETWIMMRHKFADRCFVGNDEGTSACMDEFGIVACMAVYLVPPPERNVPRRMVYYGRGDLVRKLVDEQVHMARM